jgi:alpha-beta hydrolase superfamily lysophospholipase
MVSTPDFSRMTDVPNENGNHQVSEYTAGDGFKLKYRHWDGAPRGDALLYLHGIESHSEWFSACAGKIVDAGPSVYALDRRGSGLNERDRGDCPGYLQLIDDIVQFEKLIAVSHSKVHLAALSWGGKLAVAVDMLYPGIFETITLITPGIFPRIAPGMLSKISIALDALFRPEEPHPIPIEDEMFTSVPVCLTYIANDPLRLRKVTARFYLESFKLDRFLKSRGYQWTAPTQLLLADRDDIVDNRRLGAMFESLRIEAKKVKMYSGCKHSLLFENPAEVVKDIGGWMQAAHIHENSVQSGMN